MKFHTFDRYWIEVGRLILPLDITQSQEEQIKNYCREAWDYKNDNNFYEKGYDDGYEAGCKDTRQGLGMNN